ncbi:cytochrome P450 4d1-like [Cochliomyia hominivorax]
MGIFIYFYKFKYQIDITHNIPSPPSWPIVGHAYHFIGQPPHQNIIILMDFLCKYGNTLKVWLGPELNFFLGDIKDAELVLSNMRFNDKADEYDSLDSWLKEGLLISRGKKWHKRRKIITPAFHFKSLEDFIKTFEKESRLLVKNLESEYRMQNEEKGIDLYEWVNLCTLDTICGKNI